MMKFRAAVLLALLFILPVHAGSALAAPNDTLGTDFWLTYLRNFDPTYLDGVEFAVFISARVATTGTVEVPGLAFSAPFSVAAGGVATVALPNGVEVTPSDAIVNLGVHVTSADEVSVYGLNRKAFTTDALLGLPVDILGTEYLVLAYTTTSDTESNASQFAVVAISDATTVTITPSVTVGTHTAGAPYSVALNQGQVYFLNSPVDGTDLTGTIITSTLPVAVFGSNSCSTVPPDTFACDHLVEQLPPTSSWGTRFVTAPLATRTAGDIFRVLASQNTTTVNLNGAPVATLNTGQVYETSLTAASEITSDKPVLLGQYCKGSSADGVASDPFFVLVGPREQYINDYIVTTPVSASFTSHYVNILTPAIGIPTLTLDGAAILPSSFSSVGATGFSFARLPISSGAHRLSGDLPFGAYVYGFGSFDSYGYGAGGLASAVAIVTELQLLPLTATVQTGSSHCVSATVTDIDANPVEGIRVDFTVTGVNPTAGFAITDVSGIAQFCFPGALEGTDTITASVGGLTATVTVDWTTTPPPATMISINDVSVAEGNAGTIPATFTVTRSNATPSEFSVDIATADLTATAGSDYVAVPLTTLTFAPGATMATVTVLVNGDTIVEANETFAVNLSNPTSGVIADGQGVGTIRDDEIRIVPARVSVLGGTTVCEGQSATLSIVAVGTPPWTLTWSDGFVQTLERSPGSRTVSPSQTTRYTIVSVRDRNGPGTTTGSATITVTPTPPPPVIIGTSPVVVGAPIGLSASGGYDSYQWYLDGVPVPGVTGAVYSRPAATESDEGTYTAMGTQGGCASPLSGGFELVVQVQIILPVFGSTAGAFESSFRTELQLHYRPTGILKSTMADGNATGRLVFWPAGGGASVEIGQYDLAPGTTLSLRDLLSDAKLSGVGSVDVLASTGEIPSILARVVNDQGAKGTTGMAEGAVRSTRALVTGDRGVLLAPHDPVNYRMNIGVRTLSLPTVVRGTVRGRNGVARVSFERSYPPNWFEQLPVAQFTSVPAEPSDAIELEVTSGSAIVYGSILDNRTSDPGMQLAQKVAPAANGSTKRVIVVAGSVDGGLGSRFRTLVQIHNAGDTPATATMVFHAAGVPASAVDPARSFEVPPHQTLLLEDVVDAIGATGLGSIDVLMQSAVEPVIQVRVYNDAGAAGTTGMLFEASRLEDAIEPPARSVLLVPPQVPSRRFNIGIRSLGDGAIVRLQLRNSDGDVATAVQSLLANTFIQLSAESLFGTLPEGGEPITVIIDGGSAIVYGTSVDNVTQDPDLHFAE